MPWGWECRAKLIKQRRVKPTIRDRPIVQETDFPGPGYYEAPKISGGPGFSKIKRAPAYTFGHLTPATFTKTVTMQAPMLDTRDLSERGRYKIPGGLITPHIEPPGDKGKVPGPNAYQPVLALQKKRAPAYSIRTHNKPPYQDKDVWNPPPNMYLPPMYVMKKCPPAFTFGYPDRHLTPPYMPGPGEHNPNFGYVRKTKPAFSFGGPYKPSKPQMIPSPNTYCEKKFLVSRRTPPAPSFGIRHSPYLGKRDAYLKPPELDLKVNQI